MIADFEKAQKFRNNGRISKAIHLYQKVRAECMHMIGVSFYQEKRYNKAHKALMISKNEFAKIKEREFVGFVLRDLGMNARSSYKLLIAEKFLKQSVEVLRESKNKGHEGISRVKLGRVIVDRSSAKEGVEMIRSGIKILKKSKEVFFYSSSYLDLAKVMLQIGNKEAAEKNAVQSLSILNSFAGENEFLQRRKDIDDVINESKK